MPRKSVKHWSTASNEDDDDYDYRKKRLHDQTKQVYHNDHPSRKELKQLADNLMSHVAERNNDRQFRNDAIADTIAVGLTKDSILITGNVKTRRQTNSADKQEYVKLKTPDGKQKAKFDDYGINHELSKTILSEVQRSKVYKKSGLNVKIIEEKQNPRDNANFPTMIDKASDHQSKHAETKMSAHCEKTGTKLKKVGISKEPCKGCHADLNHQGVAMKPETPGTKKVINRRNVDKDEVEVRNQIERNKQTEGYVHFYNNNMHASTKEFTETVKNNAKRSLKPGASVGLISGGAQLYNTINSGNYDPYADGGLLNARAGAANNLICGETYYANASVAEGRTGFGDIASIGASALSAGAYAEYGLNNSVGANLSLARLDATVGPVQASVGLNADTHASVGVNGVSASVLGFGFSVGPRMGIQTPFCDFSVTLF